jgi:hypothetical protein
MRHDPAVSAPLHAYVVEAEDGRRMKIDFWVGDYHTLGGSLHERVTDRLRPDWLERFDYGATVTFGKFGVSREALFHEGTGLSWRELTERVEREEWITGDGPVLASLLRDYVLVTDLVREKTITIRRLRRKALRDEPPERDDPARGRADSRRDEIRPRRPPMLRLSADLHRRLAYRRPRRAVLGLG